MTTRSESVIPESRDGITNNVIPESRDGITNNVIPESREAGVLESRPTEAQATAFPIPDPSSAKSGMTTRSITVFTQDFGDHEFFSASGISSAFGLLPDGQNVPGHVILFLPREKERLDFLLHFLATTLPPDGTLWLVGENKAGIKSAETRLKVRFAEVGKMDAARHCVLFQAKSPLAAERPTAQGFAFPLDAYRHNWTLPTPHGELHLQSLPGAFAHGHLDKGTALLLEYLQSSSGKKQKVKGKVLDFGCGAGVIGLSLKQQNPDIMLDMLDSSASALESTRESLQLNGYEAGIIAADGLHKLKTRYDWIITNPPFHKGVNANLSIARKMMARAPALLGNRGKLLLVCNRHLPYEAWLGESFASVEKVSENREFKVLMAFGSRRTR
jgi:16S rRNA (guanine1207-N2)-methyltransferase